MLQHSWNQVCLLLKLILCFLIHLFSPFFLCFKLENRTCLYVNSQVTPKATNCMQLPPGKHLDILHCFAIESFLRGDLEKVKKYLKKNDINSLDGQGRYIKKLSDQRHSPPLSLCFWHLLTSDLLYLYLQNQICFIFIFNIRSALHLAAAAGHLPCLYHLVAHAAHINSLVRMIIISYQQFGEDHQEFIVIRKSTNHNVKICCPCHS